MASVKWTAADLPDQSGRTAIVTGASSGIGLVTARELARAGARVVLALRNTEKGQRAAASIPGRPEVRPLDLASLASVRAFAAGWTGPLDILVNNAGIMAVPEGRTVDGFELQIGTNHLGPFLLTGLLLPAITDRVVTVSSQLHRRRPHSPGGSELGAPRLRRGRCLQRLQAGQRPVHPGAAAPADRGRQPGAGRDRPSRYRQDEPGEPGGQGLQGDLPVSRVVVQ
jgi:NAD(P)-dependent dehydrogenase (short-subunit alcohol dehydrogenase family)